jgi:hypothetical protein
MAPGRPGADAATSRAPYLGVARHDQPDAAARDVAESHVEPIEAARVDEVHAPRQRGEDVPRAVGEHVACTTLSVAAAGLARPLVWF